MNTTQHDVDFFILNTNTTETQIQISISSNFFFVPCISIISCHNCHPYNRSNNHRLVKNAKNLKHNENNRVKIFPLTYINFHMICPAKPILNCDKTQSINIQHRPNLTSNKRSHLDKNIIKMV